MKTRLFSFLAIILFSLSLKASVNDTVWTTYEWDGIKVSVLGGDLYYYVTSKVLIEPAKKNETLVVSYDGGLVERTGKYTYMVTPHKLGNTLLRVSGRDYPIQVFPVQDPKLYITGDTRHWKDVISVDDLKKAKSFSIKNKSVDFQFVSGILTLRDKQGDLVDIPLSDTLLPLNELTRNGIYEHGQKIFFEDLRVKNPDGSDRFLPSQSFLIVDNYANEFVRKTVSFLPNSSDLGLLKSDLRIRLEGMVNEKDRQAVTELADELNGVLKTIQIKITNYQPSLRIVFDTSFVDSVLLKQGFKSNSAGMIARNRNLFFPFRPDFVMYINPQKPYYSDKVLKKSIVELLGNFNSTYRMIGQDSTIFNGASTFSPLDKYMLGLLYSDQGEQQVKQLLKPSIETDNQSDLFFVALVFSICLFFLFSELYTYYGFGIRLKNTRVKIVGKILEALLIAQIPVLVVVIFLIGKFFTGYFSDPDILLTLEYFFLPFALFCSLFFAAAELLLKRIKKTWLSALTNTILSFFVLLLSYQLVYFIISPEIISLSQLTWQVLLVGFLIILYRLYARLQSKKIAGLLQQKELELSKQKELKFKSDLNALQARINPHFLYNSLNSIASLAHSNAEKTEKMALSLSKLFRYNLNKEDELFATISDEAAMTETYLDIEKIRFEDKMSFSIDVQESLQSIKVPKFILQPLAENAVKHGISKISGPGIIAIRIFEKNETIMIEVADNGPEFPGGLMNGYGLQNVYDKLNLLCKKPFSVEFVNSPEKKVLITLNIE